MIYDRVDNITDVLSGEAWKDLCSLVASLTQQSTQAASQFCATVRGMQVSGNVDRYTPATPSDAPLEAHQKMVDLQIVLAGVERIDVHPISLLKLSTAYDADRDVAWYSTPDNAAYAPPHTAAAVLTLTPGTFALFFPRDAHRPKMPADNSSGMVTKIVFKIPVVLL